MNFIELGFVMLFFIFHLSLWTIISTFSLCSLICSTFIHILSIIIDNKLRIDNIITASMKFIDILHPRHTIPPINMPMLKANVVYGRYTKNCLIVPRQAITIPLLLPYCSEACHNSARTASLPNTACS